MTTSQDLFESALAAEGVSGKLAGVARSIYMQESGGGRNTKTSNQGARGGMQIIPATFKSVADKEWNIDDPVHNARAGIRYLKQLDKQAGGDPALTAAGYYGGPGGLEKARRGVAVSDPKNPKAPNTLQYAQQVVGRLGGGSNQSQVVSPEIASVATPAVQAPPPVVASTDVDMGMPPELLAHRALTPAASVNQADAWASFLKTMPQAKRPVQVADLNFGSPKINMIQAPVMPTPSIRNVVPNFAAFNSWRGQA